VRAYWCKEVGIPERCEATFRGIDGRALLKNVDVAWMEARGIPHDHAIAAFKDIERLRGMAQEAGLFTKLWWWL
jgi:hypothetical protein